MAKSPLRVVQNAASLAALSKLYFDGVAGTGDTYIVESSANNLSLYAGGRLGVSVNSINTGISGTLDVYGESNGDGTIYLRSAGSAVYQKIQFYSSAVAVHSSIFGYTGSGLYYDTNTGQSHYLRVNGSAILTVNSTGAAVTGALTSTSTLYSTVGLSANRAGSDSVAAGPYIGVGPSVGVNTAMWQLPAGGEGMDGWAYGGSWVKTLQVRSTGLTVTGVVTASDVVSTSGGVGLQLRYGTTDYLNTFGAMYSSGATMLGYGVRSSTTTGSTFLSTSAAASHPRGALVMDNALRFYQANASLIAVGTAATLNENFTITTAGDMVTSATKKHYLDGASGVGGDTYLVESAANTMDFYAGGTNTFTVTTGAVATRILSGDDSGQSWHCALSLQHPASTTINSGSSIGISFVPWSSAGSAYAGTGTIKAFRENATVNNQDTGFKFTLRTGSSNLGADTERLRITSGGNLAIGSTAKLYLDGVTAVGDTYLVESAANTMDLYAGGIKTLSLSTTGAAVVGTLSAAGSGVYAKTYSAYFATGGGKYALSSASYGFAFEQAADSPSLVLRRDDGSTSTIATFTLALTSYASPLAVTDTTNATSTTAASLKTAGGLGVAKAAVIGYGITVGTELSNSNTYMSWYNSTVEQYRIGYRYDTGEQFVIRDVPAGTTPLQIAKTTGVITLGSTTDSSSTTTGALVVSGGLGVAKKAYFGDSIVMATGFGTYSSGTDGYTLLSGGSSSVLGAAVICFGQSHATVANELHLRNDGNTTRFKIKSGGNVEVSTGNLVLPKTSGSGIQVDPAAPTWSWRDLEGVIQPKESGAGAPVWTTWSGNIKEWKFVANDIIDLKFHWPHDHVPGTDVYIHVHWSHTGSAISGSATVDYRYRWGKRDGAYEAERLLSQTISVTNITSHPALTTFVNEIQLSAATPNTTSGTYQLDTDNFEPDGLLKISFKVNTIPTITAGDFFIEYIDIHYQSSNVGTKNKASNFYA